MYFVWVSEGVPHGHQPKLLHMMKSHSRASPPSSSLVSHTHPSLPPILNLSISHLAFASSPLASVPSARALITSLSRWHPMMSGHQFPTPRCSHLSFFFFPFTHIATAFIAYSLSLHFCSSSLISYLPFNPYSHLLSGSLSNTPFLCFFLPSVLLPPHSQWIVLYSSLCHSYILYQCHSYLWLLYSTLVSLQQMSYIWKWASISHCSLYCSFYSHPVLFYPVAENTHSNLTHMQYMSHTEHNS